MLRRTKSKHSPHTLRIGHVSASPRTRAACLLQSRQELLPGVHEKFGTRHRERESATIQRGTMACAVRVCVIRKFQRLMPCGLSDRGHLHYTFILSALRAALSLSSSSRNDLFTVPGCDVHGHTALAVHRVGGRRSATDGLSQVSS